MNPLFHNVCSAHIWPPESDRALYWLLLTVELCHRLCDTFIWPRFNLSCCTLNSIYLHITCSLMCQWSGGVCWLAVTGEGASLIWDTLPVGPKHFQSITLSGTRTRPLSVSYGYVRLWGRGHCPFLMEIWTYRCICLDPEHRLPLLLKQSESSLSKRVEATVCSRVLKRACGDAPKDVRSLVTCHKAGV